MSGYQLGPVPQRVVVEVGQVRQLVAEQCPQWAHLSVRPVAHSGWDNRTFHLGDDMVVRLPSAAEYEWAVPKEHRWLPVLAETLTQPIPAPLFRGLPGAGYGFCWSVYGWLPGETARWDRIADPSGFAQEAAAFVASLRSVDPTDGPRPGVHNWYRGGTLRTFEGLVDRALREVGDEFDPGPVREVWEVALAARWDGVDRWFHGDLAPGNILLVEGRLGAVIDFGTCGVGDPACDLAVAWTLLDAKSRTGFRDRLGVGDAEWARGRGWALWKALDTYAGIRTGAGAEAAESRAVVNEILKDYRSDGSVG